MCAKVFLIKLTTKHDDVNDSRTAAILDPSSELDLPS